MVMHYNLLNANDHVFITFVRVFLTKFILLIILARSIILIYTYVHIYNLNGLFDLERKRQ